MDQGKMKLIGLFLGVSLAGLIQAAVEPIKLESPKINTHDMASIKRGAKHFKARCSSCHGLNQAIYDPVVLAAGMNAKNMPVHTPESRGGHPPPDLSLVSRTRGDAWVYTYLQAFFEDPIRRTGYNNLLLPNTNMPPVLADLQGTFVQTMTPAQINRLDHQVPWYRLLKQVKSGQLKSHEFELYLGDLVNFLNYVAEPTKIEREELGWKVLLFLFAFWCVMYALYRSYWDPIKRSK